MRLQSTVSRAVFEIHTDMESLHMGQGLGYWGT